MVLTGENRSTRRETPSTTSFTTNLFWTTEGSNPGYRVETPASTRLTYSTCEDVTGTEQ